MKRNVKIQNTPSMSSWRKRRTINVKKVWNSVLTFILTYSFSVSRAQFSNNRHMYKLHFITINFLINCWHHIPDTHYDRACWFSPNVFIHFRRYPDLNLSKVQTIYRFPLWFLSCSMWILWHFLEICHNCYLLHVLKYSYLGEILDNLYLTFIHKTIKGTCERSSGLIKISPVTAPKLKLLEPATSKQQTN